MVNRRDTSRQMALRVAVLVTLEQGKAAGGHVKCWERFAEAATAIPDMLDLTVHFIGEQAKTHHLSKNVRYQHHRPMIGTRSLSFLRQGAGHTDLAPFHPGLNAALADADIVHATDFFSFGKTGLRHAKRHGKGLVASVHTDAPQFTRIYAGDIIKRITGARLGSWLVDGLDLPRRLADRMSADIDDKLRKCHHVLVSKPEDHHRLLGTMANQRLTYLQRGIDRARFSPNHRDRTWLHAAFHIPVDRQVLMFAGRVDASKSVMVMAEAVKRLLMDGQDVHALIVGHGEEQERIASLLGDRVTLTGNVTQSELGRFYASSDLFLFPSTTEVCPNVVIEAKASGLPVIVAASHGGAQFIRENGVDGVIAADQHPTTWAAAAARLIVDRSARQNMCLAARDWAETEWPSWSDVLNTDLMQAWTHAADLARIGQSTAPHPALATNGSRIGWNETGGR